MVLKIGDLLFDTFTKTIEKGLALVSDFISDRFVSGTKTLLQAGMLNPNVFETQVGKDIATEFNEKWSNSPGGLDDVGAMLFDIIIGRIAKVQFEAISGVNVGKDTPYLEKMFDQMAISTDITVLMTQLGIAIETLSLGQIDTVVDSFNMYLDKSGYSQLTQFGYGMILASALGPLVQKEILYDTRPTMFDPSTLTDMYYKNLIMGEGYLDSMHKLGYTYDKSIDFLEMSKFFPSAGDFIRFMVREVYRSDVVEKYGYDEDFPIAEIMPKESLPTWIRDTTGDRDLTFAEIIKMGRLDPEILTWYWRSHWELPSPLMGYEMLHRGLINEEELTDLLRIGDYAPFWIPKMIGISYSPYTRVDARRMFETGTLSDDEYLRAIQDIGYPLDKAEKLLEWATRKKMGAQKDLTMSMVLDAYETGLKDRKWAIESLYDVGYDTDEAELIVSLTDYAITQKDLRNNIKMLSTKFVNGLITLPLFKSQLDKLGLNEAQKNKATSDATLEKDSKIMLPTRSNLGSWLSLGLISEVDYKVRMTIRGYQPEDIELYIAEIMVKAEASK
jgi:hypothetical protein